MTASPADPLVLDVWRPADSVHLRFKLFNLVLEGATIRRGDASQPSVVVVELGPQHLAERPLAPGAPVPDLVEAKLSDGTRLCFIVPQAITEIPASLEGLLNWDAWTPSLVPAALPPAGAGSLLRQPGQTETSIELPYRLVLSPDPSGRWEHAVWPVERQGRIELWHSRLHGTGDSSSIGAPVRAVWSPDYRESLILLPVDDPALSFTLTPRDRNGIVERSAHLPGAAPIDAAIMLSATGGWLHAHGSWPAGGVLLSQWEHRATEGRDHYVRTAHEGVLLPFGHRAAHVTVSERTIEQSTGGPAAVLRNHEFIVVREPERQYQAQSFRYGGLEFPFSKAVRFTTLVAEVVKSSPPGSLGAESFFALVRSPLPGALPAPDDYLYFALEGTDHDGRPIPFHAPCLFVSDADLQGGVAGATAGYMDARYTAGRAARVDGHRIAFAPAAPPGAGDESGSPSGHTDLATTTITLSVQDGGADSGALPDMQSATVSVPVLAAMGAPNAATIRLHPTYLTNGFDTSRNPLELFAETLGPLPFSFPADRSGGLVTPSIAVDGLSRLRGPVGDVGSLAAGNFEPKTFFGDAKLLGGVGLADLINGVFGADQLPRMVSERLPPNAPVPDTVRTRVDWAPAVVPRPGDPPLSGTVVTWRTPSADARSLELHAAAEAGTSGKTSVSVEATLRAFTLSIPSALSPYVSVAFEELHCEIKDGAKPHVTARLSDEDALTFGGPLTFVNELRRKLPATGFGGAAIDLTPTGLNVGYGLALPPVSVGVFDLHDLRLGAALHLPFTGEPARLRLAFSERAHPCVLTISMLGGGAFLALAGGTDGIEAIEGALEFGGSFELSLVVATGGVTVMAGVYFKYERTADQPLTLAGYLRASGEVSVLGLISVSVDFMLTLTWQAGNKVSGDAELTVKIEILFFSKSVSLRLHKEFQGSSADPTFGDLMTNADWQTYAGAFA